MTVRNHRLPAVLLAGIMLGMMLLASIGATQGETTTLLKGSFRGQAYATAHADSTAVRF